MDDKRFDALTRSLAEATSRRKVLKGLLGGLFGGAAVATRLDEASADHCSIGQFHCGTTCCDNALTCCGGNICCPGNRCTTSFACCPATSFACSTGVNACCDTATQKCCDGVCISASLCCPSLPDCPGERCCPDGTCAECCDVSDCLAPTDTCLVVSCSEGQCLTTEIVCQECESCSTGVCVNACPECSECVENACTTTAFACGQTCCDTATETCCDGACCAGHCIRNGTEVCCPTGESFECGGACCPNANTCCDGVCCAGSCNTILGCCVAGQTFPCDDDCCDNATENCCGGTTCCPSGRCNQTTGTCCQENQFTCGTGDNECCDTATEKCCDGVCISADLCCPSLGDCTAEGGLCCTAGGLCSECCDDGDCGECETCIFLGFCARVCPLDQICCVSGPPTDITITCAEDCCGDEDCSGECGACYEGQCVGCGPFEECCRGTCVDEGDCCRELGEECGLLIGVADGSPRLDCCSGLVCCENDFTNQVTFGMYCAECCNDWGCGKGYHCCHGECIPDEQCCDDHDCGDCEVCETVGPPGRFCRPSGRSFGETCGVVTVAEGGSPQLDCCDGLVCCGVRLGDDDDDDDTDDWNGGYCAECCGDWDCPKGAECHKGICQFECRGDKDCAPGTCCCKSGNCSKHCCDDDTPKDEPRKPGKKPDVPVGGVKVDTLPATGAGDEQSSAGWLGAAALGAAAAYLASKKLKDDAPEAEAAEE